MSHISRILFIQEVNVHQWPSYAESQIYNNSFTTDYHVFTTLEVQLYSHSYIQCITDLGTKYIIKSSLQSISSDIQTVLHNISIFQCFGISTLSSSKYTRTKGPKSISMQDDIHYYSESDSNPTALPDFIPNLETLCSKVEIPLCTPTYSPASAIKFFHFRSE